MRLMDAIIGANHRAVAGDTRAGLRPAEFADELPLIALTCIYPGLNSLLPNALGLPPDQFIWLRNAGNIIFDSMSSMTRSLAMACAVKGGREIAIIGHTACQISRTGPEKLTEKFEGLGVQRHLLPEDLNLFFGLFSSQQENVTRGCDIVRRSPLISPSIPVHGLIIDSETGRLDWVVNGYEILDEMARGAADRDKIAGMAPEIANAAPSLEEVKLPEPRIGELATKAVEVAETNVALAKAMAEFADKHWPKSETEPPKISIPPQGPPEPAKK